MRSAWWREKGGRGSLEEREWCRSEKEKKHEREGDTMRNAVEEKAFLTSA